MPYRKNYLEIEKEADKELYRICKELESHGKSIIKSHDNDYWCSASRKIGVKAKPLINRNEPLLYPPMRSRNNRHHNIGAIIVPSDVVVKEEIIGKKNRFHFFKRKK